MFYKTDRKSYRTAKRLGIQDRWSLYAKFTKCDTRERSKNVYGWITRDWKTHIGAKYDWGHPWVVCVAPRMSRIAVRPMEGLSVRGRSLYRNRKMAQGRFLSTVQWRINGADIVGNKKKYVSLDPLEPNCARHSHRLYHLVGRPPEHKTTPKR